MGAVATPFFGSIFLLVFKHFTNTITCMDLIELSYLLDNCCVQEQAQELTGMLNNSY